MSKEKKKTERPNNLDDSLVRLNISIFRQVARLRPDLVREEYRKLPPPKK